MLSEDFDATVVIVGALVYPDRVETSSAITQAVEILVSRLSEARQTRDSLTSEIASIEEALTSLSVYATEPSPKRESRELERSDRTVTVPRPASKAKSVRAAVKEILDRAPAAYTSAEVYKLLPPEVLDGKSHERQVNSVRTALWSLRDKNEAFQVDDSHTMSIIWSKTTESPPARTEELSDDNRLPLEGGGSDRVDERYAHGHSVSV